jgi:hypothetical protein
VLVILALAFATLVHLSRREPRHQNVPLSAWLQILAIRWTPVGFQPGAQAAEIRARYAEAEIAVRAIGTNATPWLVSMLRVEDTVWRIRFSRLVSRQNFFQIAPRPARQIHADALEGFRILGPVASSAVPELAMLLDNPNTSHDALQALAWIGGPEAVKPFTKALRSPDAPTRLTAAMTLQIFGVKGEAAVPALLESLADEDDRVRNAALTTLGRIGRRPDLVIPALTTHLNHPNAVDRIAALESLSVFGPAARSAIPAILASSSTGETAYYANQALRRIDPRFEPVNRQ